MAATHYYHVTEQPLLEPILSDGLEPRIGPRSTALGEEEKAICLFTSRAAAEDALMGWMGDAFDEDVDLVLLEVDVSSDAVVVTSGFECEARFFQSISPDRIRVVELVPSSDVVSPSPSL